MQTIGLCRFSYPAIGGFQVEHDDLATREAYLYAPARMEERFRTFECFTLPALKVQTDPDFTFLIVIGESLPDTHRQRLNALVEGMPQAVIAAYPPAQHRAVMKDAINAVRCFDKEPCLQFRMDDDDAVAVDYVSSLREAAQDVRKLSRKHKHLAIDFNQGFIARPSADGIAATKTDKPYMTAGLALMLKPRHELTIMNFAHMKVAQHMPTVTFTGTDMILRGHNDYNDSRQKDGVKPVKLSALDAAGEAHFKARFNIDADHVRQVFSTAR
ncbi:MAG: putative rhamnosyl transferase [Aliishimia sp.]